MTPPNEDYAALCARCQALLAAVTSRSMCPDAARRQLDALQREWMRFDLLAWFDNNLKAKSVEAAKALLPKPPKTTVDDAVRRIESAALGGPTLPRSRKLCDILATWTPIAQNPPVPDVDDGKPWWGGIW